MLQDFRDILSCRPFDDRHIEERFQSAYSSGVLRWVSLACLMALTLLCLWPPRILVLSDTTEVAWLFLRSFLMLAGSALATGVVWLRPGATTKCPPGPLWLGMNLSTVCMLAIVFKADALNSGESLFWGFCVIAGAASLIIRTHLLSVLAMLFAIGLGLLWIQGLMDSSQGTLKAELVHGLMGSMALGLTMRRALEITGRDLFAAGANDFSGVRDDEGTREAKLHMVRALAHDMRQPSASTLIYTDLIKSLPLREMGPTVSKYLDAIILSVKSLSQGLDQLLGMAEAYAGGGQPQLESVDLSDIMGALANRFSTQASSAMIELVVHQPPARQTLVITNRVILEQILNTLVNRALSAPLRTGQLSNRWVVVRPLVLKNRVQVRILDNGEGNETEISESKPGQPSHSRGAPSPEARSRTDPLRLVKYSCALLGHHWRFRSSTKGGSFCSIDMALGQVSQIRSEADAASGPATPEDEPGVKATLKGAYVLIVEDDPHCRYSLNGILKMWGLRTEVADDALSAMNRIDESEIPFDLIITDYRLPGKLDGVSLLRSIRQELVHDIPGIVTSADREVRRIVGALPAHTQYLPKPIDAARLRGLLHRLLSPPYRSGTETQTELPEYQSK